MNKSIYKISDLGYIGRGKSKHRPRNDESLYGGNYPFIQTADVKNANLYLSNFEQTYNEKGLNQSKLWQPGTLLITIAANIAETAILNISACFPDSIVGFIPDTEKTDVRFIKYYIDTIKLQMQSASKGTTQDNLSVSKLMTFDFIIPDLKKQIKIADTISSYDLAIENNNHRIQILEEIAQRLYEEWFVNFKFPGHEKVKMVDSELGKIPEGWRVKQLEKLTDVRDGTHDTPKKIKKGIPLITTKNIKGGYLSSSDYFISEDDYHEINKRSKVEKWNILVSMIGTVGEVHLVDYIPEYAIKNVGLVRTNNSKDALFIFHYLKSKAGQREIASRTTGASQQFLSLTNLRTLNLIVPNDYLMDELNNHVLLLQKQIRNLIEKNKILAQTRDLLLPRLISGEIEV